jgi:hypothetical protein
VNIPDPDQFRDMFPFHPVQLTLHPLSIKLDQNKVLLSALADQVAAPARRFTSSCSASENDLGHLHVGQPAPERRQSSQRRNHYMALDACTAARLKKNGRKVPGLPTDAIRHIAEASIKEIREALNCSQAEAAAIQKQAVDLRPK